MLASNFCVVFSRNDIRVGSMNGMCFGFLLLDNILICVNSSCWYKMEEEKRKQVILSMLI
jgi:hypothetical protein